MDGHSALNAPQGKASGLVLLVLEYGNTSMLQDRGRNVRLIKCINENNLAVHEVSRTSGSMFTER